MVSDPSSTIQGAQTGAGAGLALGAAAGAAGGPIGALLGAAAGAAYGHYQDKKKGKKFKKAQAEADRLKALLRAEKRRELDEAEFVDAPESLNRDVTAARQRSLDQNEFSGGFETRGAERESEARRTNKRRLDAIQRQRALLSQGIIAEDSLAKAQEASQKIDNAMAIISALAGGGLSGVQQYYTGNRNAGEPA